MSQKLQGKKVAILVEDGFEQVELTSPKQALEDAGAEVHIISPEKTKVKGWEHTEWGDEFDVDVQLHDANPEEYDALVLPGGVLNPDKLRRNEEALEFIRYFDGEKKPISAICHGAQSLIDAELVAGRTLTSYSAVSKDLQNAGANWVDRECVIDDNLVTSRHPDDLEAFNENTINKIAEQEKAART